MGRANKKHIEVTNPDRSDEIRALFSSDVSDDKRKRLLTVYTTPIPKGRPRFTRSGHAYTPKKTTEYEMLIRDCWRMAHKDIFTGTVRVTIDFYMPIPKSMSLSDKKKAVEKKLMPCVKPDIDNLIKSVLDALNETAFWDDKQIVKLLASEYYSTEPRIEISVMEI